MVPWMTSITWESCRGVNGEGDDEGGRSRCAVIRQMKDNQSVGSGFVSSQPKAETEPGRILAHLVVLDELACMHCHRGSLDGVHFAGTRLGRKDGKDARASAHIQDYLALELAFVSHHGLVVSACALVVLQHLFLRARSNATEFQSAAATDIAQPPTSYVAKLVTRT
jgi:hypothetical protein